MDQYIKYTVKKGDTIQGISYNMTGDVTKWLTIAKANDLDYPYVDSTGNSTNNNAHLATVGDTIIIPQLEANSDQSVDSLGNKQIEEIEKDALGEDLSVIDYSAYYNRYGGDDFIVQLSASKQGDLKTVAGMDNIKQMLIMRLLTPKGSLLMHPDYGSDLNKMFLKNNNYTGQMINNEISKCLQTDTRVSSVEMTDYYMYGNEYSSNWIVQIESLKQQFSLVISKEENSELSII